MGFALVYDTIFTHPIFDDGKPFTDMEAWLWTIMNARRVKGEFRSGGEVFPVPIGCLGTRYRALSREWKWSVNRVRRFLDLLQNQSMIDVKTEHGFVLIRVCNFEKFQNPAKVNGTATEQQRNSNGTATDTNRTRKHVNTVNNIPYPSWLDLESWEEFKQHRKEIKSPLTSLAEQKAITALEKLVKDGECQKEAINRSIASGWKGIFPNKKKSTNQPTCNAMERYAHLMED